MNTRDYLNRLADAHGAPRPNRFTPSAEAGRPWETCTCDRDTLADNMATPDCPIHAPLSTTDTEDKE